MHKLITPLLLALALTFGCSSADDTVSSDESAASVHWLKTSASATVDAGGDLDLAFKLAGLGDTVTTTITATANATATYACANHGNKFPSDPKKQTIAGPVSGSGDFTSSKNGSLTGILTLAPPPSTLDCPPGQHEVLASVSYTDVVLSEPNAGPADVPGTFERVFFVLP